MRKGYIFNLVFYRLKKNICLHGKININTKKIMKSFYITTPIFYANDLPHIGTSYTVFIADTFARYYSKKLGKENVLFLTGTDEHGNKVAKTAKERNQTPKEFVDEISQGFKSTWEHVGICFDYFMRTTHPEHKTYAQNLIQKAFENGDLYEGQYSGLYCEGCEAYYKETDLIDNKCPNHPSKTPVMTTESNYYFKLSKYRDRIMQHIKQNSDFIKPEKWRDYIIGVLEEGLEDIPVTRANVEWGIPVPFAPDQTIYVWYDALPNYISYLNFAENKAKEFQKKFWENAVHVVGKDILRFHAVLWPAMLMSVGLPLPKTILVNGFFTVNGTKIGKSNGNAINPVELVEKYGIDAVRYALLTEFQIGNDGDFSFERLEAKYHGELGNNFGNLLNRVIHLSNKKNISINDDNLVASDFRYEVRQYINKYHEFMHDYKLKEAADVINDLFSFANKYIDQHKPWLTNDANLDKITLNNLSFLLYQGIICYEPIIPNAAKAAMEALLNQQPIILFKKYEHKSGTNSKK
jgi:methionyl-tRNA synthetase